MTVKEQFNVAGLPTTWGRSEIPDWRPADDALAVARLKAAGAVILGKTNVPLSLADWQSYNEIYGTTNNPVGSRAHARWIVRRRGGGACGGVCALELGSDIGGSLRAPGTLTAVCSRTSRALTWSPMRGGGTARNAGDPDARRSRRVGPMARSAADLALELDVLAGPDEMCGGIGYRLALPPSRARSARRFPRPADRRPSACARPRTASPVRLNDLAERLGKSRLCSTSCAATCHDLARTHAALCRAVGGCLHRPGSGRPTSASLSRLLPKRRLSPDDDSLWRAVCAV